jgi:uncharacterized membrane protein YfcA
MDYPVSALAIIGCAFVLAGVVKGVLGMGLPSVAMAILGLVMPPAQAASVLVVPSLVTNVWQLAAGPHAGRVVKRFAWMMVAICLGTFAGIALLTGSSKAATATLGIVLALYGAAGLAALRFTVSPRHEPWLSPLIGFLTGLLTGATGVFVIPAVPYIASLDLDKEALIQTLGLSFTVSTIALAAGLIYTGHFHASVGTVSLLALLPALAGMFAGQHIRNLLRPEVFRRWFFAALVAVGIFMAARALA